ncbi:hypothetical protein [Glutamicibacter arilaitensis]|uniref:hypothetical protein n=1 Tax=Glutamicibacter arilaitensis TaxID=256701 RepID=UPI0018662360|nr:hypothetical protein [Glutamicibacter arilaitensis]
MNDHEESEIMQDFGQILRTVMGSGMQAAEQSQRRAAMRAQEQSMSEAKERAVAQMIGQDFASDKFWRAAGSEAIADRMTLSLELATKHGASSEAARAFMTGADRIRNQYGINVEDINNDHPSSAVDRHHALRDALDDHLAGERANAEAKSLDASQAHESNPNQPEATHEAETAPEQGVERGEDVAQAKDNEAAHLGQAEQFEGEKNLDQKNTETAEAKEVTTAQKPEVGTRETDNVPLNQHSDASQRILQVWREKSGGTKNPSIAQVPTLEHSTATTTKRPKLLVGQAPGQSKEQGLSR